MKTHKNNILKLILLCLIVNVFLGTVPNSGESYAEEFNVEQVLKSDSVSVGIFQFHAAQGPFVPSWHHPFRFLLSGINNENFFVGSSFSKKTFPLLAFVKISAENSFHFYPRDLVLNKSLLNSIPLYLSLKNFRI